MKEILDQYRAEGLSFFPVPYKSKQAIIEWKQYQARLPTDEEIAGWKSNGNSNFAVVCGAVSGNLVVIDFDSKERFHKYLDLFLDQDIDLFTYTRIVRTQKGAHVYFRLPASIKSQKFPEIDIKAEGGYVIAPPSVHPTGSIYEICNPGVPIRQIQDLKAVYIDLKQKLPKAATASNPSWVSQLLLGVKEGSRDESAKRLIGYFRNTLPAEVTEQIMLDWNQKNRPPLDEGAILEKVARFYRDYPEHNNGISSNSIYKKEGGYRGESLNAEAKTLKTVENVNTRYEPLRTVKVTSETIKNYVLESGGQWIFTRDLDSDLNIRDSEDKNLRRQVIFQMVKAGLIEKDVHLNNKIRFINNTSDKITLDAGSLTGCLPLVFPFQIQNKVDIFPKNIIAVAGSMNAGKTAFLLNTARMNKARFQIVYFSSEMAQQELTNRVIQFGDDLHEWDSVDFRERGHDFIDVIRPDWVNIIDYLELTENMYLVGSLMEGVYRKLNNGIAIIALQKKIGALLGRGQEFSAEKPRLYLSMDDGKLTIVKGKNWHVKGENPKGQFVNFKLVNGCEFIQQGPWQYNRELGGE